jgi:hypothetical protein
MTPLLLLAVLCQKPAEAAAVAERPKPFVISVVDAETGRGVPMVELKTVNNVVFVTDSAGRAAIDDPGLMGRDVFFMVRSFGYEYPKDGFGFRGKAFPVVAGGEATLRVGRVYLAERIYRVTGEGIYRDTVLAGKVTPIRQPLLNAGVLGQDSSLSAIYGGKVHWFWGDTNLAGYPLGNFHAPGATSLLPGRGGLDPGVGVDLTYFVDEKGVALPTAKLPGEGPTWLTGLSVFRDRTGRERMFATYEKIHNGLETYRRGLVEWDESKREFHEVREFPLDAPVYPQGHTFLHSVGGVEYVYFAAPLPMTRVRATPEAIADLSQYEAYTPLKPGAAADAMEVERDSSGKIVYGWKKVTAPARSATLDRLRVAGTLKTNEMPLALRDDVTMRPITPHSGSVYWNAYRRRWVAIFVRSGGWSPLGDVHYAEADTPLGPWVYTRCIARHSLGGQTYNYSFYNPTQHPFFDADGGRTIYFEGTYANTFSGNGDATPRYDYNQIMYKLDLGRPELSLPVPIYALSDEREAGPIGPGGGDHPERHGRPIVFFAPDHPAPGTVPVYEVANAKGGRDLVFGKGEGAPLFHALPLSATNRPLSAEPLVEFVHDDGIRHAYSTDHEWTAAGYRRTGKVLGFVWRNPIQLLLPRE